MRILSVLIVILMSVWVPAAQSQERPEESGAQATALLKLAASETDGDDDDDVEEVVTRSADEATKAVTKSAKDATKAVTKSAEEARTELRNLVDQSHSSVKKLADDIQSTTGISGKRAFGIAAGMLAGAIVVDMMGGGGLVTIAAVAGSGLVGNWIMSE